jgi:hypothetical protein
LTAIWRRGLLPPLAVGLVALLVWPFAGGVAALALLAVGAFAIVLWHVAELDALARWASGALEDPVP